MVGIDNPIVFYPISILLIVFVISSICLKNIFYSLLCAIAAFFVTGLLFYVLGSEYNAIIHIAIYGVAVPIILGLAIMFTDFNRKTEKKLANNGLKYSIILTAGIFILGLVYLIMTSLVIIPTGFNVVETFDMNSLQVISSIASAIFVKYVWAFELVSVILTIIVVGISLSRKEEKCRK